MKIHPQAERGVVQVGQYTVAYHDTGTPGDERVPVVLVRGTGGTAETHFRTLYPMLAARHRVLAIDWVAVPVSPRDEGTPPVLSVDDVVRQIVAVIETRAPGQAINLVGYSLGAVTSAALAAARSDLVKTLTLVAGWIATDRQQILRRTVWQRIHDSRDLRALREFQTITAFSAAFLRSKTLGELEAIIANRHFPDGILTENALNDTIDIAQQVADITAPTLVIGCTADQMVPIEHSYMLFGGILNARFAEIESGHAVTVERPAQVFKLIDDFVKEPAKIPAGASVRTLHI